MFKKLLVTIMLLFIMVFTVGVCFAKDKPKKDICTKIKRDYQRKINRNNSLPTPGPLKKIKKNANKEAKEWRDYDLLIHNCDL